MTLLSPAFLWALAALLPLAAVYLLKVRPRRTPATAMFLWQRVQQQRKATSLFRRLRDAASLVLVALAMIALALAMARPQFGDDDRRDLLILIDRSASMVARDGGATRLARARDEAQRIVRALDGQQRAAVASVAGSIRYHAPMTTDRRALSRAIDAVLPGAMPMRADALAELAERSDWADDIRVVLLSDGLLGGGELPDGVELLTVGGPADNAGIVACDMQRIAGSTDQLALYVQLASSFDEPVNVDLLIEHDGAVQRVVPMTVQPGLNDGQMVELTGPAGPWRVRLDIDDALPLDDAAYLVVARPQPIRVTVAAEDRYFFDHSVQAFADVDRSLQLVTEDADVVLAQRAEPATNAPLQVIFAPQGRSLLWGEPGEPLDVVLPRPRVDDHAALRYLNVASMRFRGARRLHPPDDAVVLVETHTGMPLIYQVRTTDRTSVVINLDPAESELFLSVHFPVLVHNIVSHLARRTEHLASTYRPGEHAPIPGGGADITTRIARPGADEPRALTGERLGPLRELGIYQMDNDAGVWLVGTSLASPHETLLEAALAQAAPPAISRGWPPSSLLLLLAIVVLVAESLLYHRRKVG
ncbi:MAG: VWA domain-containing protein [Phycisphaeraceae bacterium]